MGRILVYLVVGYVLLVFLMTALAAAPWFLLFLVLLVFLFFRRRGSWMASIGELPWRRGELEAAPSDEADRLHEAAERLAPDFPEDRLESAAIVAVLAPLAYEPDEERRRVEQEFDSWQTRFTAWRQRLDDPGPRDLGELADEHRALEAYVAELNERAAEANALPERALDEVTRAGALIKAARESCDGSAFGDRLDVAAAKHAEAWAAVGGDAPRPVTALRLAEEAAKLAEGVQKEAARVAGLPAEVRRRLQELSPAIEHMRQGLDLVETEVRSAASTYAVSSWREIGGVGGAAREALERAVRLYAVAEENAGSGDLERAARALDDVAAALEDATRLREAIEAHLRKLESAALEARDRVVAAEKDVDRAVAQAPGADHRLERAGELVRQARAGLESERPDWLAIVELADRAAELVKHTPADPVGPELEEIKARARDAHETALAWALVAPEIAESEHALLEDVARLYGEGEYAAAEEAAQTFVARVQARHRPRGSQEEAPGRLGHALVWDLAIRFSARG